MKIQNGTGNDEDFEHYFIFNVFSVGEDLDIDEEMGIEYADGGLLSLPREPDNAADLLSMALSQGVAEMAFGGEETELITLIKRN